MGQTEDTGSTGAGGGAPEAPPDDDASFSLIGTEIAGKYTIQRVLGVGGMAQVFKARQQHLERDVAVKVLKPPPESDVDLATYDQLFLQEASAAAALKSPHSITVYDFGQDERGYRFIVMEYLEGRTLEQVVDEEGPLSARRAVHIGVQICRSLREAHERGMVHRDLKPANVMLVDRNNDPDFAKVLDFGIVKDPAGLGTDAEASLQGRFVGSPRFAAPEQLQRSADVDARADIYSFGLLMYFLLAGDAPFSGSARELFEAHQQRPPRPIESVHPDADAPAELRELVSRCLAKLPEQRPAEITEVIRALGEVPLPDASGETPITAHDLADFAREIELDETDDALRALRAEAQRRREASGRHEQLDVPPDEETTDEYSVVVPPEMADTEPGVTPRRRVPGLVWVGAGLLALVTLAVIVVATPLLLRVLTGDDAVGSGGGVVDGGAGATGTPAAGAADDAGVDTGGGDGALTDGGTAIVVDDDEPVDGGFPATDGADGDAAARPATVAVQLTVRSTPTGAGVTMSTDDGERWLGRTPLDAEQVLPDGADVVLVLRKDGYRDRTVTRAAAGGRVRVETTLEALDEGQNVDGDATPPADGADGVAPDAGPPPGDEPADGSEDATPAAGDDDSPGLEGYKDDPY